MSKHTFQSRRNRKIAKINPSITLNVDYDRIDNRDIYGYYIMNRMEISDIFDLPMIGDFHTDYPDFIALISRPSEYDLSERTCISFYEKDIRFDDIDGLYEAIIYKDTHLLLYYKSLLINAKYFIAQDYSIYGNFKLSTLIHQFEKEAVVIGWLVFELGAIVYPNITYGLSKTFDWCFKNIYKGSNIAISLKGCSIGDNAKILKNAVKKIVDEICPMAIIVYSIASYETTFELLEYAYNKGIKILVLDNTLRTRNLERLSKNG